jgi:predicted amidohydrolase
MAYYDKIHLFDVDISRKEVHRESKSFHKGNKVAVVTTPWGKIGLTICYDIRFPNLYRNLVKQGVKIILVPAAFTVPTGKDHWEILLRSRAIENTSFIIATGQCGKHHARRATYGHSMIVNPWGKIIIKSSKKPKVINAIIDMCDIENVRSRMPSINHDLNRYN